MQITHKAFVVWGCGKCVTSFRSSTRFWIPHLYNYDSVHDCRMLLEIHVSSCRIVSGGSSRWSSPPCDCCCKGQKGGGEGESGTSFNELSTSSSESQSEASSPQGTVIRGPVSRQAHVQTLDRPLKKERPGGQLLQQQQSEQRRKSDLLRTLTSSSRDTSGGKKRPAKEKMSVEEELEKCIKDFHKIKIPEHFPERKHMWQADLLRKYRLWGTANKTAGKLGEIWTTLERGVKSRADAHVLLYCLRLACLLCDGQFRSGCFNAHVSVAQKGFVRGKKTTKSTILLFFFFFFWFVSMYR